LDTHPITTKCVSAGLVSSLGNILAQAITHYQELNQKQEQKQNETSKAKRQWQEKHQQQDDTYLLDKKKDNNDHDDEVTAEQFQVDLAQVSRFAFLNVVFVAPILHHWYQFINRAVPGTSFSRVAQRVFWDEFVFSPMYLPVFLGMLWKLEGSSNDDIIKMIKSEVPTIVVVEWALWVPAMFGTFRFVPVKFQVLAINTIGVVGQTFLAYMANHAKNNQDTVVVDDDDDDTDDDVNEMNKNVNAVVVNKEQEHQHERAPRVVVSTAQHVLESVGVIEKNGDVPPEVVVEDKVVPLVLNTIIRKHTPKHVDLDMKKGDD
jgi:peroxisomal membrane protein 2